MCVYLRAGRLLERPALARSKHDDLAFGVEPLHLLLEEIGGPVNRKGRRILVEAGPDALMEGNRNRGLGAERVRELGRLAGIELDPGDVGEAVAVNRQQQR